MFTLTTNNTLFGAKGQHFCNNLKLAYGRKGQVSERRNSLYFVEFLPYIRYVGSDWYMKYQQKDFTEELRKKIENTESALKKHIEKLLNDYTTIFTKKNLKFEADFDIEGENPFMPGYISSVAIVISDENGDINKLRVIQNVSEHS